MSFVVGCADPSADRAGTEATSSGSAAETSTQTSTGVASEGSTDALESSSGAESSGGGWIDIDCSPYCDAGSGDDAIALCYACRCKNAMEGFLPGRDQLQCSQAEPLTIYTADVSGAVPQLVPLEQDSATCANPALLTEECGPGSRLGQLQEGSVFVKWICRDPDPDTGIFADAGAIVHNAKNGATCYFDDIDNVTGIDDWPDLDLVESDQANLDDYLAKFYFTDGNSCSRDCHDADPFIYTPYFSSIEWHTGSYVVGPYARVALDGELDAVNASVLVANDAVMCRACHRLGSAAGCDFLSPDALGDLKSTAHEQAILDATEPGSPNWSLAYWMPDDSILPTFAMWELMYGAAKDRITTCCADPGVATPDCPWEPLPR